jgi:hypothetical protein
MKSWLKRIAMAIGGVVVAALLLALVAPKAVHAIVSTLVTVANTSSNPVPARDVDNSANFPFSGQICLGDTTFCKGVPEEFTVPAVTSTGIGVKRLVVETTSGVCTDPDGGNNLIAGVGLLAYPPPPDNTGDFSNQVLLPVFSNKPGFFIFGGPIRLYASPGATITQGESGVTAAFSRGGCYQWVTGYLVVQ